MKRSYIISGTAIATFLTIIALLRDVFDFKLQVNDILNWVYNPILYWVLTIFLFLAGIAVGLKFGIRKNSNVSISVFDLSNANDAQLFYIELYKSYREAQSEVYLTGTGFISWSDTQDKLVSDILNVTSDALSRGVSFVRIQMSDKPAEEWADKFSNLMQSYPERLKVYADYESTELANTALIDPDSKTPIVQLLFETEEVGIDSQRLDVSVAMFIYGRRDLAKSLQKRFLSRMQKLQRLLPNEMRELGLGIYYFAYTAIRNDS